MDLQEWYLRYGIEEKSDGEEHTSGEGYPPILGDLEIGPDGQVIIEIPNPNHPPPFVPETITSLEQKLASKSITGFGDLTQSDVEDWNAFMRLSAQYHYLGFGEQARAKAYTGNINKEFHRSIKGEMPQTPAVTFRKDFAELRLQPARDWDEYYDTTAELARAVRKKTQQTMALRRQAMESPCAVRARARGLFVDRDWFAHEDQVSGYFKAWSDAETLESLIQKCREMWQEEKELYARDPASYRWKDPAKLVRAVDLRTEEEKETEVKHIKLIRQADPRRRSSRGDIETDEEWEMLMRQRKEANAQIVRPAPTKVTRAPLAAPEDRTWSPPPRQVSPGLQK